MRGSEEGGMVNPGLESLRMVQILELCGSLYLKREVNILCGCHDLIAKMFYEATEQWGWKGLTGAWELYAKSSSGTFPAFLLKVERLGKERSGRRSSLLCNLTFSGLLHVGLESIFLSGMYLVILAPLF